MEPTEALWKIKVMNFAGKASSCLQMLLATCVLLNSLCKVVNMICLFFYLSVYYFSVKEGRSSLITEREASTQTLSSSANTTVRVSTWTLTNRQAQIYTVVVSSATDADGRKPAVASVICPVHRLLYVSSSGTSPLSSLSCFTFSTASRLSSDLWSASSTAASPGPEPGWWRPKGQSFLSPG